MHRRTFLTIAAIVPSAVGVVTLVFPGAFLQEVKAALPSETANVMARTVGVLLLTIGALNFMVRDHEDSPTLRAVCIANLFLQIAIIPIDPLAYFNGVYTTLGAFVPNTVLHVGLAYGFAYYLRRMRRTRNSSYESTGRDSAR